MGKKIPSSGFWLWEYKAFWHPPRLTEKQAALKYSRFLYCWRPLLATHTASGTNATLVIYIYTYVISSLTIVSRRGLGLQLNSSLLFASSRRGVRRLSRRERRQPKEDGEIKPPMGSRRQARRLSIFSWPGGRRTKTAGFMQQLKLLTHAPRHHRRHSFWCRRLSSRGQAHAHLLTTTLLSSLQKHPRPKHLNNNMEQYNTMITHAVHTIPFHFIHVKS